MRLTSEIALLGTAIQKTPEDLEYLPTHAVPLLLGALAGLFEAHQEGTPLGSILQRVLDALQPNAFASTEVSRLAKAAGRCGGYPLLVPASRIAKALRSAALILAESLDRTPPNPMLCLDNQVTRNLSERRRKLILYLLRQAGQSAHERDVIAHMWPKEGRKQDPSERARNRLHQLQRTTNQALMVLEGPTWQIQRQSDRELRLVRLGA